jgi:hypothetical protein
MLDPERFWARVSVGDAESCWEWAEGRTAAGYGETWGGGNVLYTHRVAWELAHGPIPPGMYICHTCDNPPCCNPAHLFVATPQQNVDDKVAKGRQSRGTDIRGARLTEKAVLAMRQLYAAGGLRQIDLAAMFGVAKRTVQEVTSGRTWAHVGGPRVHRRKLAQDLGPAALRMRRRGLTWAAIGHALGIAMSTAYYVAQQAAAIDQ